MNRPVLLENPHLRLHRFARFIWRQWGYRTQDACFLIELIWSYFTGTLHLLTPLLLVLTNYKQTCFQDFPQLFFCMFLIWVSQLGLRHKYTSLVRLECGRRKRTEEGRGKRTEAGKGELWLWEMLDIVLVFSFDTVGITKILDRRLCCYLVPTRSVRCAL